MTTQEKFEWYSKRLTMLLAPPSDTVAQAVEEANLTRDTQNLFVRQFGPWNFYCHLCTKNSDEAHLTSAAHRAAVALSATISWTGWFTAHRACPSLRGSCCRQHLQSMCRARWGPQVDNIRARK